MRHGKKINKLGRTPAHRKALMMNMANSLIEHKRIQTTQAKAKALREYIEPLVTKSKEDTLHNRRIVFRKLKSKEAINELFGPISDKIADRPGGYTRIIKLQARRSDSAELAMIEFVDFNELYTKENKPAKTRRTRRSRRGGAAAATAPVTTEEKVVETEEVVEEENLTETTEETTPEVKEETETPTEEKTDTTSEDEAADKE